MNLGPKLKTAVFFIVLAAMVFVPACRPAPPEDLEERPAPNNIEGPPTELPAPEEVGKVSLEETLSIRKSTRSFQDKPLSLQQLGQLLWAAQGSGVDGITGATRTAPSAGATHPMEIYVVAGNVQDMQAGIYIYDISDHKLVPLLEGELREELAGAALGQDFIAAAPASIVLAAEFERTTGVYGQRGERYVHMESGNVSQNIALQAEALGLGSVVVGAFEDRNVSRLLQMEATPLLIIPVGHPDR